MSIPGSGSLVAVYRPPSFTVVATPIKAHEITYRPEKNGTGGGQVTIPLDDPAYPLIHVNDVIAIRRGGVTVAAVLAERLQEHTLDIDGGARQVATYGARLIGAWFEWAVIAPALGDQAQPAEDDAVFDYRSPRYDRVAYGDPWVASTELMSVTAAKAGGWPTQPMGEDFTDSTGAMMIWAAGATDEFADPGTCFFLHDITITTPGRHVLEVLMDNDGWVWVDGVQQLEISDTEGYHRASFKRIELTAGTHRFAFRVRNFDGPAALAYNLFKADHQDRPMPGVPVVATSSSATLILEYPAAAPGMYVTDILGQLLAEADDRGALTWVNPSFTFDEDSNSDSVPRISVTTKTGTTLLQFLDELVSLRHISRWRQRPDGVTFDVFGPGYSTRPGDVELTVVPLTNARTGEVLLLDRTIT